MFKKLKVAAYCRVSTDDEEQLNSYETQVNYYTGYIKSKPDEWEFAGIYADEGITGTSARKRKDFLRMIQDAMDGKINIIIVKSVSRYARNTVDSLSNVRMLRDKGIKIFFEKENIDSLDPKCDMILSIYSSLAEEESRSISTNIRWSVQKRFEKGKVIMTFNNLMGYADGPEGSVVIVEKEAEIIREIYTRFLLGTSYTGIIEWLEGNKILTPKKKEKWTKSTIRSILGNEKYIGDAILQKTYKRDFLCERRVKNTGQAEQKYVENNHPAIIERNIWNAVQAEIERRNSLRSVRKTGKGRYTGQFAFSGKIECGNCGAKFRRHNHIYKGRRTHYWSCISHLDLGMERCIQRPLKESYLENLFVLALNDMLSDKADILKQLETVICESMRENSGEGGAFDRLKEIEIEASRLQDKMSELNKRRTLRDILLDEYNVQTKEIIQRLDGLFAERDSLTEKTRFIELNEAQFETVTKFLSEENQILRFDKDVFIRLVEKVIVYEKGNIVFGLKNGLELRSGNGCEEEF